MSTRFGMADGRLTNNQSSRIYFDELSKGDPASFDRKVPENPFKAWEVQPQQWTSGYTQPPPFKNNKPL